MTITTNTNIESWTDEEIANLPLLFPEAHRNYLMKGRTLKRLFEPVWSQNYQLRVMDENRAGRIGDFYKENLPKSSDEMFTLWASSTNKADHLRYAARYLSTHIPQDSLPSHLQKEYTAEVIALIVSAHFLIDRSYNGFRHERALCEYVNTAFGNDASARFATGDEDKQFSIDLFINETGFATDSSYGVQVKPVSFFRSTSNVGLLRDRKHTFSKIQKTEKYYGIPVKWHIVNDEGYDFYNPTKPLFHTTEEAFLLTPESGRKVPAVV